jgi:hypothetical protein
LGKHWRDVIDPEFLQLHATLDYFSLDGKRFYLPAYLIAAVEHPDEAVDWVDAWTKELYPRPEQYPAELRDYVMHEWDQLMKALTARQKHAIRLF